MVCACWFILSCSKGTGDILTPSSSTAGPSSTTTPTAPGVGSSTSEADTAPSGEVQPFRLLFRDDFDTLDTTRWQLMTHSWGGNLALFSRESPLVENGELSLRLLAAPEGTTDQGEEKPFLGAEVRSRDTLTYGRVRARVRFAKGSGVISSLVTIYTPWPADNWNELDIETLGQSPDKVQYNAQVYTGPLAAEVSESVTPTQAPHIDDLEFDTSLDFHEYEMEWTPESATFAVDGVVRHTWSERIDLMNLPQNVLLTIWASNVESWAGAVTPETLGATATYDWVELWEYTGSIPANTRPSVSSSAPEVATDTGADGEGNATTLDESLRTAGTQASAGNTSGANLSGEETGTPVAQTGGGGETSASETSATGVGTNGFRLVFRDDFDTLDTTRWQLMTHSWDSNLALFSSESVTVTDGHMTLTLLDAPDGTVDDTGAAKSFLGAEVRSRDTVEWGRVRARVRFSNAPAVVSALVTIYTPWPADNWNELDIEHLGSTPEKVQFNTMVYTGAPPAAPVSTSVTPTQFPELVSLGFDASADFHVFEITWTPDSVRFLVDGDERHQWSEQMSRLGLAQNTLLTIWASSSTEWAGAVGAETTGATAVYDWVELYEYVP